MVMFVGDTFKYHEVVVLSVQINKKKNNSHHMVNAWAQKESLAVNGSRCQAIFLQ